MSGGDGREVDETQEDPGPVWEHLPGVGLPNEEHRSVPWITPSREMLDDARAALAPDDDPAGNELFARGAWSCLVDGVRTAVTSRAGQVGLVIAALTSLVSPLAASVLAVIAGTVAVGPRGRFEPTGSVALVVYAALWAFGLVDSYVGVVAAFVTIALSCVPAYVWSGAGVGALWRSARSVVRRAAGLLGLFLVFMLLAGGFVALVAAMTGGTFSGVATGGGVPMTLFAVAHAFAVAAMFAAMVRDDLTRG